MDKRLYIHVFVVCITTIIVICFGSCTSNDVRKSQNTIALADSLLKKDDMYKDTIALHSACNTLAKWRKFYPTDYALACLHYGRLLQERNNPVAAMQYYMNATHVHTKDYMLLGHVYSQMGTICNDAEDYQLMQDMYQHAAINFLLADDTIRYYKSLQMRAMALANLREKDESLSILREIESNSLNDEIQRENVSIKSIVYGKSGQYDSAFFYLRTYIFSYEKDSATQQSFADVISFLESLFSCYDGHNIDSVEEETLDWNQLMNTIFMQRGEEKDEFSEQRKETNIQATQILWHDIHHQKSIAWVYSVLATLFIIGIIVWIYYSYQEKRHALLTQRIAEATQEYTDIQKDKLAHVESACNILFHSNTFQQDVCWRDYDKMCEKVDNLFYLLAGKLQQKKVLNETELRLSVLVFVGFNHNQIAVILPYARNSIGKLKDQTAKKLGTTGRNLHVFLVNLAVNS